MDLATIITIVGTAAGTATAIIASNIALISWLRSDMKEFETKIETNLKASETKIETKLDSFTNDFRKEMTSYKNEIAKEMRDFHGRLCSIEERNKGK